MDQLLREYLPVIIILAIAIGLGIVLLLAAVVLAVRNPDPEKVSAYECGFTCGSIWYRSCSSSLI